MIQITAMQEADYIANGEYTALKPIPLPERLTGVRTVSHVDTTGFYLKQANDNGSKRGSFCDFPKSSNLMYDGATFTITEKTEKGQVYQTRTYKII